MRERPFVKGQMPEQRAADRPDAIEDSIVHGHAEDAGAELAAMTRLHELSARLVETAGLQEMLGEVLSATIQLQNADFGSVQLYHPDTGTLRLVAHRGFSAEFAEHFRVVADASTACGRALRRRARVVVQDIELDPEFAPHRQVARSAGFRAVQSTPMLNRDGEPLGVLSTHFRRPHRLSDRDLRRTDLYVRIAANVIDRQQTQEALRRTQARLESALRAGLAGTFYFDTRLDRVITDHNLARYFSLPHARAVGEGVRLDEVWPAIHDDDRARVVDALADALRVSGEYQMEYRVNHEDGTVRWLSARGSVERDSDGVVIGLPGFAIDITDRKCAEERFRESEARYRTLFMSIDEGFCLIQVLLDETGKPGDLRVLEVNDVFEQQTGLRNAAGRSVRDLLPGLEQFWFDVYGKVALTGEPVRFEQRAEPLSRWFDVNAFRTGLPERLTVALLFKDITARKQAEHELRDSQTRLRRALEFAETSNQMKDDFLATVSHELRTPLNTVLGWAGLLGEGGLDEDATARAIRMIETSALMQAKLVEDLLDVSRIVRGQMRLRLESVELHAVVREAIESVAPLASAKPIRVIPRIDPMPATVTGDAARLQQIVWNLLSNAIKFTPPGGLVVVRLERANAQARLSVTDSGEGIETTFLPHVFDRFRQADGGSTRPHGGLGLGLAIVRHLVELHGGSVEAESPGPGEGATFTVLLPLAGMTAVATPSREARGGAVGHTGSVHSLAGVDVLAVEDSAEARELLTTMLERRGARVTAVGSARAAMDALAARRPDVLISDIGMPGEDGLTLIQRVRALDPERGGNVPAVAVTAYTRGEDEARILAAGYQKHISKPVDPAALVAAVGALVKKLPPP